MPGGPKERAAQVGRKGRGEDQRREHKSELAASSFKPPAPHDRSGRPESWTVCPCRRAAGDYLWGERMNEVFNESRES